MSAISQKAKDNQKLYQKKWVNLNRDKVRTTYKRYFDKNREKILNRKKVLRKTSPEVEKEIKSRYRATLKARFVNLRGGANNRNLSFEISFEQYESITALPCKYCGEFTNKRGIDRVDNNIGYIESNCASCCIRCNMMKREMSVNDFYNHIRKILKNE